MPTVVNAAPIAVSPSQEDNMTEKTIQERLAEVRAKLANLPSREERREAEIQEALRKSQEADAARRAERRQLNEAHLAQMQKKVGP